MVEKNKIRYRKISIGICVGCLLVLLFILGAKEINRKDAVRLKSYEDAALLVGITRAEQECVKEGLGNEVCNTVTGVVSTSECNGRTCWIVYARSNDPQGYGASITINRQNGNGNYVVIDYLRDTGTRR